MLRRDWRSGELRLLALSLVVAVAAVTAVAFFTDRVERAMELQAAEMLAADLVIASNNPIPESYAEKATAMGLQTARSLSFPSVVLHGEQTQLVGVKAVSPNYPLRGKLHTRGKLGEGEQVTTTPPLPGKVWAAPRLLVRLGLDSGKHLMLGERKFVVQRVISRDGGQMSDIFQLGPRLLLALEDIPTTGLVTPASRVRHRLLVAGAPGAVSRYTTWVEKNLTPDLTLEQMQNARPVLRNALERADRYLGLAALVAVLISGAAIALSTRRFIENQSDTSAILRCLGASRPFILWVTLIRLLLLGLAASLFGSLVGYGAQFFQAYLMSDWFGRTLPAPSLTPIALGVGTALITLFGFTLAPLLRLGSVPPLRVLRRELGAPPSSFWLVGIMAFVAISLLMLWQAADFKLAVLVVAGTLFTLALLLLSAHLLVAFLTPLRQHSSTLWRYGLAALARNPGLTAIQLTGFGLGILALLLITIVRVDLLETWEKTLPPETPNQFLINIQPSEVGALRDFLHNHSLGEGKIYPMMRARLTHINQHTINSESYKEDRARRLIAREFNLSWAKTLPPGNNMVTGLWWQQDELNEALFSVEQGVANTLGIGLGDRLIFDLAGVPVSGQVKNIRSLKWDSFQPNFFIIGTPGMLREQSATFITSFYLPPGKEALMAEMIREFPAVTAIDVEALMVHIRQIMERGALAVEYVFLFTLAAGLLVLIAGIQANRESRRQESAILRTLGLKRRQLLIAVGVEFITLGVLAGLLASLCASLTGWVISRELFELEYHFNPWIVVFGTVGGGVGIGLSGLLTTYPLVIKPPLHSLAVDT